MKVAEKVAEKLERNDKIDLESGFRLFSWEEVLQIFEKFGKFEIVFEENSSVDPSCYVVFADGSRLYVGNPYQSYFPRFYIVSEG